MKRQVLCQYCQAIGIYQEIHWNHIEECPDYPVICDNESCNEVIKYYLMKDHYNICPKQVITCQYNNIGYNVKMKQEDRGKYEEHDIKKHLEMGLETIEDLQAESVTNKALLLQLQAKLDL